MAFQFPWTNLHELNLDWFLSKFKQFTDNFLGTTATAESVPYGTQPSVTVTGGELDEDTDIVDPFTFNFKIPAGEQGVQGEQGIPGQDGFSPIATVTKSGSVATITITDANGTTTATISDGTVTQDQLDTKAPIIIASASGSVANFKDGADNIIMQNIVADIDPVQDLSNGDPSPTNICPITGWTGVTVYHSGADTSNPQTISMSWQSEVGTVYGGTIDLSTGVLTVTHAYIDLGTLSWTYYSYSGYSGGYSTGLIATAKKYVYNVTPDAVCSALTAKSDSDFGNSNTGTNFTINASGLCKVTFPNVTDSATLKSALSGVYLCYELDTYQTYQLTPQQLFNTLYGVNNVWNDTGDSTVTYPADTKLFIEQLTQPTEDDMTANSAISSGKFFMIGNNLYRATTTIASGSQIIPGTNATPMSLADALNLL